MTPANKDLQPMKRGDTYPGFKIAELTYQASGLGVDVASARMQIKETDGTLVYEYSTTGATISLSGTPTNRLDLSELSGATTASFATGKHKYDLEVTLATGEVWTVLNGNVCIDADITI